MPISLLSGEAFPGDTFTDNRRRFKFTDTVHLDYPSAFDHAERMIHLKHGRVDAIIFKKFGGNKVRYFVYLARRPKEDRTISAEDAADVKYEISAFDRKIHINSMYDAGQRGLRDMSKFASRFIVLPPASPVLSAKNISPDHDILGFDHPREDILVEKTKAGKTMRTGGNTFGERSVLADAARVVLNRNFTREEVRKMNLYFEASDPDPDLRGVAGTCSVHEGGGMPVSTVSVRKDQIHESVVTHEIVHALRAVDGRYANDMDSEEIETEYETTLRLQKPRRMGLGYYQYMPDLTGELYDVTRMRDAALADRVLATGATDKPLKGRRLTHDVAPNTIGNSRIATAQPALRTLIAKERAGSYQMIAEDVDTYFQIKLPDKSTVEYHIRFNKARPSLAKIKKHLKAKFGKNIEAWEWHDGKRVRLISRPKKPRTRKQTTTKRTPAKRKTPVKRRTPAKRNTPTRKPVAAKRYGLDAILGVPEGIL